MLVPESVNVVGYLAVSSSMAGFTLRELREVHGRLCRGAKCRRIPWPNRQGIFVNKWTVDSHELGSNMIAQPGAIRAPGSREHGPQRLRFGILRIHAKDVYFRGLNYHTTAGHCV